MKAAFAYNLALAQYDQGRKEAALSSFPLVSRLDPGRGAAEVARAIGEKTVVSIAKKPVPGRPAIRYVPNINRATSELQLDQWTPLDDAIRSTALWHRKMRSL